MLVLDRWIDEQIIIGDDIVLTIIEVRGGKVRIGISAPVEIPIFRDELVGKVPLKAGKGNLQLPRRLNP